jgi:hypothetical protein
MAFYIILFPVIMQNNVQELPGYILKVKHLQENPVVIPKN